MAGRYRRPLLTFYLSAPPQKGNRGVDFRTLPQGDHTPEEALLDALVREIRARQSMVRIIMEDEEEAEPLPFVGSHLIARNGLKVSYREEWLRNREKNRERTRQNETILNYYRVRRHRLGSRNRARVRRQFNRCGMVGPND